MTDAGVYASLLAVKKNGTEADPNLVMDFELEENAYHILFSSASTVLVMHVIPAALYASVAYAAFLNLRTRARHKVPTPPELSLVLKINLAMMLVLGPMIATNGYFTAGSMSDAWCMPFRSLLLGCSVASSSLIVGVWNSVIRMQTQTGRRTMRYSFAVSLIILDLVCNVLLLKYQLFGGTVLWVYIPMAFFLAELGNVTTFTWRALKLFATLDALSARSGTTPNDSEKAQAAFRRRTALLVLLASMCSVGMLSALLLVGTQTVYYSSPSGAFLVGFIYVYSKAGVAACHVAICWPSTRALAAGTKKSSRVSTNKVAPRGSLRGSDSSRDSSRDSSAGFSPGGRDRRLENTHEGKGSSTTTAGMA